jgi:hypothetical protein
VRLEKARWVGEPPGTWRVVGTVPVRDEAVSRCPEKSDRRERLERTVGSDVVGDADGIREEIVLERSPGRSVRGEGTKSELRSASGIRVTAGRRGSHSGS